MRDKISLNSVWDWYVPGGNIKKKLVPSSYHCVGNSFYEKEIEVTVSEGRRAFLVFEGIAYEAEIYFNDTELGVMLPYTEYRFEITGYVISGINKIRASVSDYNAPFGTFTGWEDYGGIIRDVYLEYTDSAYIEDFDFITSLNCDFSRADCTVSLKIDGCGAKGATYQLFSGSALISESNAAIKDGKADFTFAVNAPELWSPDFPNLYGLVLKLYGNNIETDRITKQVGIREFRIDGNRFLLNGRDIYLKGVCRHEMWGEQGFTLTEDQTVFDYHLMKQLGVNYCRLVHYPHSRKAVEQADRMGIMVSEEPGLWGGGLDVDGESIGGRAKEILRRTVLRDKNSPSVIFWLVFNECRLTEKYVTEAAAVCRDNDPMRRPVSAAFFPNTDETKEKFTAYGLDFYTQHPYCFDPVTGGFSFEKIAETLCDKPLVFTEWGADLINQHEWNRFAEVLRRLARTKKMSGVSWWCWADVYQWKRGEPSCIDGVLCTGLVDLNRNINPAYMELFKLYNALDHNLGDYAVLPEVAIVGSVRVNSKNTYKPIDLSGYINTDTQKNAWDGACGAVHFPWMGDRKAAGAVIPSVIVDAGNLPVMISEGQPLILTPEINSICIDVGQMAKALHFLGQVTFDEGYPVKGTLDEKVGKYTFVYENGETDVYDLKNGREVCSSSMLYSVSRLDATATEADHVIKLIIDKNFEIYRINHMRFETRENLVLRQIIFESCDNWMPLLYGVTVEN